MWNGSDPDAVVASFNSIQDSVSYELKFFPIETVIKLSIQDSVSYELKFPQLKQSFFFFFFFFCLFFFFVFGCALLKGALTESNFKQGPIKRDTHWFIVGLSQ